MEFILFSILGVFFVIVLIGVAIKLSSNALEDQSQQEASDLAITLQEELILASEMLPGYHRAIDIPLTLRRGGYTLTNDNHSFTIAKDGITLSLSTPPLNGTLIKGRNIIKNRNGTVVIN